MLTTRTFTETATEMLFPSFESHCGLATKANGEIMVVVAGGFEEGNSLVSVQVYNITTGEWRMAANPLPEATRAGETVAFGNTFLIVGGLGSNERSEIVQFNPEDESWTVREEAMSLPRVGHYAAMVDAERFGCQ